MIQDESKARLPTTKVKDKGIKKAYIKSFITIKTKNVNSIKETQGSREEAVLTHLKQTQKQWDAWVFTETWRPEHREIIDFDAEAESEEEIDQKEQDPGKEALTADTEGEKQVCVSPRRTRHCLFGCG